MVRKAQVIDFNLGDVGRVITKSIVWPCGCVGTLTCVRCKQSRRSRNSEADCKLNLIMLKHFIFLLMINIISISLIYSYIAKNLSKKYFTICDLTLYKLMFHTV